MKTLMFIKRSRIPAPVEETFKWHSRPGALERLVPPWDPLKVIERTGGIQKGGQAILKMKAGPVPYTWIAEHTEYEENRMFRDRQVRGPFALWEHTHLFEPDGDTACFLEDRIEYALPVHPFGNFLAGPIVRQKLSDIFTYRHNITAQDMTAHFSRKDKTPLNILISGATGVIGSALIPFFTTGGHQVKRLVRRNPEDGDVLWNPMTGELDSAKLCAADTLIHLAGEHIGRGKWTPEKKRIIVESRTKGTELIAKAAAAMNPLPKTLICASAIGYYGHREDCLLSENACGGDDFISEVCDQWEKAAAPAIDKGIRVVFLRIGIALTPMGGALERLLPTFSLGLGGKIGTGRQYMSWIGIDDVIGGIYHVINHEEIEGAVNLVAPNPVTNAQFTEILGKVINRPAIMTVPEFTIRLAFGEMGKEVLLSSTRVSPEKLTDSGYRFRHSTLESALSHLLGRTN